MKKLLIFLIYVTLSLGFDLYAEEIVRFDFHNYVGEGTYDFFRIEVDLKNKSGVLCYFDDSGFVAAGGKLDKLSQDSTWFQYVNLTKVKHVCGKFNIYNSMGWFMTDSFKYDEAEYRYFFIGNIKKEMIEGKLYQFRDLRPSNNNRSYKTTDQIMLSVSVSRK